ncbi:MAG: tetratricopeptide repeat protein [Phycisphaerales bacterium]|nr:tetratricopeptide repeat protein [Phycisphaerales bacterium]
MAKGDDKKKKGEEPEAPAEETSESKVSLLSKLKGKAPAVSLPKPEPLRGPRDYWQVPVLLAGAVMILLGARLWVAEAPGPDFQGALSSVDEAIAARQYDRAIEILNDPLAAFILSDAATLSDRGRYDVLSGDALYYAQKAREISLPENNERIVAYYREAREQYLTPLTPRQTANLADTLLAMGQTEEALQEVRELGPEHADVRFGVYRAVVDQSLNQAEPLVDDKQLTQLLNEMREDPGASPEVRVWVVTQQTRMRMRGGYIEEAIERLLPEIQSLPTRQSAEAGRLFVLLAQAYFELGLTEAAKEHVSRAAGLLPTSDPAFAQGEVLQARILQVEGQPEEARDRFASVATRFPQTAAGVTAWLGLGEIEAELAHYRVSLDAYLQVIASAERGDPLGELGRDGIEASLLKQYTRLSLEGVHDTALRYAELILRLYGDNPSAAAVFRVAEAHRARSEQLLEHVPQTADGLPDFTRIDPITMEEARSHSYKAAQLYRQHARMVALADAEASAASLWLAADGYDRAGEDIEARKAFAEYVQTRPDDVRAIEARYRLARVNQARGEYAAAVELFEKVQELEPTSVWAYRSYVPLSQCLLLSGADHAAERAEAKLLDVLEGGLFEPDAIEFKAALVELGLLYRRTERYPEAIERLSAAMTRFPELQHDPQLLFALADANRGSGTQIADALRGTLPRSEQVRLSKLREERLIEALGEYDQVAQALDAGEKRRTDLEKLIRRNAMFYRGDCAYDLGRHLKGRDAERSRTYFTEAIRFYDAAAQKYSDDASSLVAMVQIVNCHAALGNWREAKTAQVRARSRLNELPPEAFENAELPMSRAHWEEWLESTIQLEKMASAQP